MTGKLTQKQERFCLAYVEGMTASDAYRKAYDAKRMKPETVNRKAKELLDNGKITARIAELRAPAVEAAQMTLEGHIDDLKNLRDRAARADHFGPAVNAEIARGKVSGLYTDKVDLTSKGKGLAGISFDGLTAKEKLTMLALIRKAQGAKA